MIKIYGDSFYTTSRVFVTGDNLKAGEMLTPAVGTTPLTYKRGSQEINSSMLLDEEPDEFGKYKVIDCGFVKFLTDVIYPLPGLYEVGASVVLGKYQAGGDEPTRYILVPRGSATDSKLTWVDTAAGVIGMITEIEYEDDNVTPKIVHFALKTRR